MSKREIKKVYRARLDYQKSKVVGWPKAYHQEEKKGFWQTIRAMLF